MDEDGLEAWSIRYHANIILQIASNTHLRASLGTTFSQGISILPKKISSFSLRKIEIPWENVVPKLALSVIKKCTVENFSASIFSAGRYERCKKVQQM